MSDETPQSTRINVSPASALDLAGLVEVASGSIVSRTIIQGPGGSMTLFAFDEGQALSEHTSPYNAFVIVLEGTVDLRIGGEPVTVTPGRMVLMPGGVPHAVTAATAMKMLLVMYR